MRICCNRCGARFDEEDLVLKPLFNESGEFYQYEEHCPECGATDALMDLEEDE